MTDEDMKVTVAVLKTEFGGMQRDNDKREKLQDARHAEMMATIVGLTTELRRIEQAVTTAQAYGRGVKATIAAGWMVFGGVLTFIAQRLIVGSGS